MNQPETKSTFVFDPRDFSPELQVKTDTITVDEVEQALNKLKSGRAAGQDQIPTKLVKYGGVSVVQALTQLINKCWEEQVPDEWRQGMIVKLLKKGNITCCSNWCGIMLLSVPAKAFCTVLLVSETWLMYNCEESKQDSGTAGPAQNKSSHCATSLNTISTSSHGQFY